MAVAGVGVSQVAWSARLRVPAIRGAQLLAASGFALAQPLFARVRAASAAGRCARECPILWRAPDGSIVEGTVDVVFEEGDAVIVMDFKTDREPAELKDQYERQLTLYCRAFSELRSRRARGVLVRI